MSKAGRKPGTPKTGGRVFQKGQSGNPKGRPPIPPELKAVKQLSPQSVRLLVSKFAAMSKEELAELLQKPDTPLIEITIGSIFAKAAKEGDYSRFNFLLDRSVGKVKDEVDINVGAKTIYRTSMTEDGRLLQELVKPEVEGVETKELQGVAVDDLVHVGH